MMVILKQVKQDSGGKMPGGQGGPSPGYPGAGDGTLALQSLSGASTPGLQSQGQEWMAVTQEREVFSVGDLVA